MKLSELLVLCPDLDCDLDIDEADIASDLVVLVRCVMLDDGGLYLVTGAPDSTTFITQVGMIKTADHDLFREQDDINGG